MQNISPTFELNHLKPSTKYSLGNQLITRLTLPNKLPDFAKAAQFRSSVFHWFLEECHGIPGFVFGATGEGRGLGGKRAAKQQEGYLDGNGKWLVGIERPV